MTEPELEQVADALVDDLFRNGQNQQARRLVLTSVDGRDLGGWGKPPVRDKILAALRRVAAR